MNNQSDNFDNLMVKNRSNNENGTKLECWICYDNDKSDLLIRPCGCKGDVSIVHHECLKLWLMESNSSTKNIRCKVCNEYYQLSKGQIWLPDGLELNHYLKSFAVMFVMGITVFSAYFLVRTFNYGYIRTISVGVATLIEYICLKILGVNLLSAYHKAKFAAIIIKGKMLDENGQQPLSIFRQSSNIRLSSTVETNTDDYSNEGESLTNLNDVESRNENIQPFTSYSDNNEAHSLSDDNHFNNQQLFVDRISQNSNLYCVRYINDDECLETEQTQNI